MLPNSAEHLQAIAWRQMKIEQNQARSRVTVARVEYL